MGDRVPLRLADDRVSAILDLTLQLAAGDLAARTPLSPAGDAVDAIALGLNLLAEELADRDAAIKEADERLEQHARRLEASEASYRIVASHADGLVVVDAGGVVRFSNAAAARILGADEVPGAWPRSLTPLGGEPLEVEHEAAGATRCVEATATDILWDELPARLVSLRDVTDRRRLESELLQAQRMSLVARLAGGVAHDFNNLLMAILARVELAKVTDDVGALREHLLSIEDTAQRAAGLTARLLAVGQQRVGQADRIDFAAALGRMLPLLQEVMGGQAELVVESGPAGLVVRADPVQLEQIVLNLVTNGRDAAPGGVVTVRTGRVARGTRRPCGCPPVTTDQDLVLLEVQDNGAGIPARHRERIFDPFFSTRGSGVGTGLGLSTVLGIAERARGHVCVDSTEGVGSTFRVFLPWQDGVVTPLVKSEPTPDVRGAATVLVVDDEDSVRRVLVQYLASLGHRVLEADGGQAALAVAREAGTIDVLLSDVVMPDLDGFELAGRLQRRRPEMVLILMSGFNESVLERRRGGGPAVQMLSKPFRLAEVGRRIAEALSRRDRPHRGPLSR